MRRRRLDELEREEQIEPQSCECVVCDDEFDRHPDDPPVCSQDCWQDYK